MAMDFETVALEVVGDIAKLTLNRPDALNAISMELIRDMRAAVRAVNEDVSVRALIITGAGRGFCAGADLAERSDSGEDDALSSGQRTSERMRTGFNPLVEDIHNCRVPVVVAVNGVAAGGGMGLALAGDIVVAAESAKFIQVFVPKLGIVPDMGCTWHLQRLAGRARGMGLALLGGPIPAKQAEDWGLIWKCVGDDALMAEAESIARQLADGPIEMYPEVRKAFAHAENATLAGQLDYEREIQSTLTDSPHFAEGVRAFIEKRKPVFAPKSE